MDQSNHILNQLAKAFNQVALSDKEHDRKLRDKYFDKVNYSSTKKALDELEVPRELRYHIPREPADWQRLSEEARKTKRANFKLHKHFPAAAAFRTGNRNKKLDTAVKNLAQRFQSNTKHNVAAAVEISTDLAKTGARLKKLIQQHSLIPRLIENAYLQGINLGTKQNVTYIVSRIQAEFDLYKKPLAELQLIFDKLQDHTFLLGDGGADGIEQIKNICLAIKNLKPTKPNLYPTKQDFKEAQGSYFRNSFTPYNRGRGRGRPYFGRRPWRGRPWRPFRPGPPPHQPNPTSYGYPQRQ